MRAGMRAACMRCKRKAACTLEKRATTSRGCCWRRYNINGLYAAKLLVECSSPSEAQHKAQGRQGWWIDTAAPCSSKFTTMQKKAGCQQVPLVHARVFKPQTRLQCMHTLAPRPWPLNSANASLSRLPWSINWLRGLQATGRNKHYYNACTTACIAACITACTAACMGTSIAAAPRVQFPLTFSRI